MREGGGGEGGWLGDEFWLEMKSTSIVETQVYFEADETMKERGQMRSGRKQVMDGGEMGNSSRPCESGT